MRRQASPDEVVATTERAVKLKRLTEYPEWEELRLAMQERRDAHIGKLAKQIGRGYVPGQEEILRHAGFWKGVFAVLDKPNEVEKAMHEMLETATNGAQPEGET